MVVYLVTVIAIVYLFPRGGQFKYQFQKGKVWQYEDYYAPFEFAIAKDNQILEQEYEALEKNKRHFFQIDTSQVEEVHKTFNTDVHNFFNDDDVHHTEFELALSQAKNLISYVYQKGLVDDTEEILVLLRNRDMITLLYGDKAQVVYTERLVTPQQLESLIFDYFGRLSDKEYSNRWQLFLKEFLLPNVTYDKSFTESYYESQRDAVLPYKGYIARGSKVVSQGEIVEQEAYDMLYSIKKQYDTLTWSPKNFKWILIAYFVLVALVVLMLVLFINKYRVDVGENTAKLSFIFFNMFLMVLATTLVLKYYPQYLYVIPFVLLPLLIKAFLDPRLGLFTHVLTVLILGFIVPNSFEFIFIQIIVGIITILTVSEMNKRANLFLSVAKITGVYLLSYVAFTVTHEGSLSGINTTDIYLFILNGLLTVSMIIPLIYTYEKLFGLVSDETLREYSDTNHPLLRELNEKAPGTFQHSLQVANLAETAAKEINANALLVRTGALYHDIGKLFNPMYFIENQTTGVNPHDDLDPDESAAIIIDHVKLGIELAKKNKLPDRLIDFIRTHHGTNLVYYFYKKEEEYNPEQTDINKFRYPGPIPFSKETAVVMICDACEAASKSLKEPNGKTIDMFVEKIVKGQMENGQFQNANITFKEIERVKRVVKKKLKNIYHIRVEYPE
jgi:putative nucleotidyltransferase with HDIG domain